MKSGGVRERALLHHHAYISALRGDLYSAGTVCAVRKGAWKTAHAWLPLEVSAPFLEPRSPLCLLTLEVPLLPSLLGEGAFRARAPLFHSLAIE